MALACHLTLKKLLTEDLEPANCAIIKTIFERTSSEQDSVGSKLRHGSSEQKQPPEVFYEKNTLKDFVKFTRKHLCRSISSNKVAGLIPATLLKKRL